VTERQLLRIIGRNIRAARLRAGLTQECLAELLNLHWQTVSNVERGLHPFSVTTFALLSQYLETAPQQLLEGIPPPDERRTGRIKKALARKRKPRPDISP
jgi:transcriptional regulator with XRE-family HTH domain